MSAVIPFDSTLRAANEAHRRAKAFGYGVLAIRQFCRDAARLASAGMTPADAARCAVPNKCERNGPTRPEAA
jgi:hypothetical protein